MGILTNVFYLISTSLLIPVMLALLWCLARALLLVGRTFREYLERMTLKRRLEAFSVAIEEGQKMIHELPSQGVLARSLLRLVEVANNEVLVERVVREAELAWEAGLERLRVLVRFGPALGLMGTLIPLGPALVGLAAGDLETMSNNLVIAFATTVVGLLVGLLASGMLSVKKAWYHADAILLSFAANRLAQLADGNSRAPGTDGQGRELASLLSNVPAEK